MTSPQSRQLQSNGNKLPLPLLRRGKVRDVYDLKDRLLIVATDRISAFDFVLPTPVPQKGAVLTAISAFWFGLTADIVANHLISCDAAEIQRRLPSGVKLSAWHEGRVMLVKKARRLDFECVVRGYLAGSAWSEYSKSGCVCGIRLPKGLREADKLPEPIFTPAAKNDSGHDENIHFEKMVDAIGREKAVKLLDISVSLYNFAAAHVSERGLLLADTKFEFGELEDGRIILIDELLTPDSSRFWDKTLWKPGSTPPGFDKQFIRDYLSGTDWDKKSPPPELPSEVVENTLARYREALSRIT
ncbi:MAG: phosphoribosylaminoimidazolesuccinocarboxamide synthase [Elusimicrobiales bacterium]|nr:phosphoribosylaminoimidazolesuccinocarboxamide synthase [Elusimicrobiales bacterium]